jgi:NAD(P)-dependent dehydrogenase (short-subunit alcohol dehydrogenase family)
MRPFRVEGAAALVTGAGSGIGRATAVTLAAAGAARLYIGARTVSRLNETAALIARANPDTAVEIWPGDVTSPKDRAALVASVRTHGRLDILVNNAGLFEGGSLAKTSDELWQRIQAANVAAPLALIRDLLPFLETSLLKAVVNIGSSLAVKPIPDAAAYNASKAALAQLTRSLALELAPSGVRVNCILPAIVETPMYRGRYASDADYAHGIEAAAQLHPLGRVGRPDDIAHAVLFLASPAAGWITGVELPVDGGMLVT